MIQPIRVDQNRTGWIKHEPWCYMHVLQEVLYEQENVVVRAGLGCWHSWNLCGR